MYVLFFLSSNKTEGQNIVVKIILLFSNSLLSKLIFQKMSKFQSLKAAFRQQNVRDNQRKHCKMTYLFQLGSGLTVVWVSVVGIASRYGMNGPGIESRLGRDFPHLSRPALGSTQPPVQWVTVLYQGSTGRGVALTTHPHLAPRLKKEYSYTSTNLLGLLGLF